MAVFYAGADLGRWGMARYLLLPAKSRTRRHRTCITETGPFFNSGISILMQTGVTRLVDREFSYMNLHPNMRYTQLTYLPILNKVNTQSQLFPMYLHLQESQGCEL